MARFPPFSAASWATALVSTLAIFNTLVPAVSAQNSLATITGTNAQGESQVLLVDRTPALFTGDFGDCMDGQSLLNLTSFDAGYFADNMTVMFNMAGTTSVTNVSLMVYISVWAYGEDRFDMVFNPCNANFGSLCPLNASIPIFGQARIPVSSNDVSNIPPIALVIPDFEGQAILRIFSNATETQIACFAANMRNGASFSHPNTVGSVLGFFTFIALVASFFTTIYGVSIPQIRTHYAHSLSVLVIFEVYQSIFFSGALSLNWPSVLPAWWSNFAWASGMIYSDPVLSAVNKFTGISGNSTSVGGAGSSIINNNGGLQQQIYGRSVGEVTALGERSADIAQRIYSRSVETTAESRMFAWAGLPVSPGVPLPGNWTGFPGTLAEIGRGIPAADAFTIGLIWFMVLIGCLILATVLFKYTLEGLSLMKGIKQDRFSIFRSHWIGFLGLILLRTCLIAFFMMMTLTFYQFSYGGRAGPIAVAVIIFLLFFAGALGLAFYACFYRVKFGKYQSSPDRIHFQGKKVMKFLPWYRTVRESELEEDNKSKSFATAPFFQVKFVDEDAENQDVHQNVAYTKRFGWLSARYRRTRWWFFAFWIVYQVVRACFVGGARANPTAQVIGLFVWEVIAFIVIIKINPFEGSRNTALAVWMLGLSKVATAGLSIGFLDQFNLPRIPVTVIGIIIIIVQGFLVIGLVILIVLGAFSTYMSLTRNRETFHPESWTHIRMKYFTHLDETKKDLPPPPPPVPEEPKEPYFSVRNVHRAPKIEDEDADNVPDLNHPTASKTTLAAAGPSTRANSMANSMRSNYSTYGNVPYGARVHRASWSSRDFQIYEEGRSQTPNETPRRTASAMSHNTPNDSISMQPLIRPSQSSSNLRRPVTPTTPTRDHQAQLQGQRTSTMK